MLPHQERVLAERHDLTTKIASLYEFMRSGTYQALPDRDWELLRKQLHAMLDYEDALTQRIRRFAPE